MKQLLKGVDDLLKGLPLDDPDRLKLLTLQGRLAKVIQDEESYGPTESVRAELHRILEELNRLSLHYLNKSFNEVAGITQAPLQGTILRRERRFLSGTVFCANVVGFSTLSSRLRDTAVSFLEQQINSFLKDIEYSYWLDFHGGDFLLFIERTQNEPSEITLKGAFLLGLSLQLDAIRNHQFQIGITIHWEDDATWHYIEDRSYLTGHALSEVGVLMAFSESGHFFISSRAYDHLYHMFSHNRPQVLGNLIHEIRADLNLGKDWLSDSKISAYSNCNYVCETLTAYDRHKRQHKLYNFFVEETGNQGTLIGNNTMLRPRVAIEQRGDRGANSSIFIQRLIEADIVAITGLTNEGTAMFLNKALEQRKAKGVGFWKKLQIIFPSESVLNKLIEGHRTADERRAQWEGGRKSVFQFLLNQGGEAILNGECLEYDGYLPFVGNWFIHGKEESVRVAPILPGRDLKETYYLEFFSGMDAYDQVADAFRLICNHSSIITEWNIYGVKRNQDFLYSGIINRKNLIEKRNNCFPVVLIMIHAWVDGAHKSLLQERTIYNGTSDFSTFSNISGRLTDADVYLAQGLRPRPEVAYAYEARRGDIPEISFNEITRLKSGDPLPASTWEHAAVREVGEELGLQIKPERLRYHCDYFLQREVGELYFRIFSLELHRGGTVDELTMITAARPQARLSPFTMDDLARMYKESRLNRLLQNRFDEIFRPIFTELGID